MGERELKAMERLYVLENILVLEEGIIGGDNKIVDLIESETKDELFAVEVVKKLAKMKILLEVKKGEVSCVNPLTVVINDRGMKRICIDLFQ